ncbi:hypothetical protein PG984_003165 [Apiospora sp. TS-2023a]
MASTLASTVAVGPSNAAASVPNVTVVAPAHAHGQMPPSQTFQLTPEMEEGIKAAVAATNPRAPAPRPSSRKMSPWTTAKYFLRGVSSIAGVGIILAEVIVAVVEGADMDTGVGAIWVPNEGFHQGLIYASWHTWRLIMMIKKKGSESHSPLSLILDGILVSAAVVCDGLLIWKLVVGSQESPNPWGYSAMQSRGLVLLFIIFFAGVGQCVLFRRAWVEYKDAERSETADGADVAPPAYPTPSPSPSLPPPPPAQIVVHYVQNTCPKCGTQSWPQPGEELNEHLANKGDMQPQAIPLSQLQLMPRG